MTVHRAFTRMHLGRIISDNGEPSIITTICRKRAVDYRQMSMLLAAAGPHAKPSRDVFYLHSAY